MFIEDPKSEFWKSVLKAVEVEPRSVMSIQGASGFSHPVVAVGIDEPRRRVIVISGESDARSAALAYGDIQAAMPSLKVMIARPVAVNLGETAKILSEVLGRVSIGQQEIEWFNQLSQNQNIYQDKVKEVTEQLLERVKQFTINPFSIATVDFVAAFKDIIHQLSLIEIDTAVQREGEPSDNEHKTQIPTFHLTRLIALDPAATDRRFGVCSIPLYDFDPEDIEVLHRGTDIDAVREILRARHILQYFFPSADQLALGFADQLTTSPRQILDKLIRTPEVGHPFGQLEIIRSEIALQDMVAALQERGLLVEGEAGVEVSESGKSVRAQVRFKPREGLFARLANVFSVKFDINLKDLFK